MRCSGIGENVKAKQTRELVRDDVVTYDECDDYRS